MALTYSEMLQLDFELFDFELINVVDNQNFSISNIDDKKPSLIMFICNHCPYVIHYHDQLIKLDDDYSHLLNLVAISSNDIVNYPEDSPDKMKDLWRELGLSFPYLYDETQDVAKKFKAACTPEFYLFSSKKRLVYRGRMDDSSPKSVNAPSANELRAAIDNIIAGKDISSKQYPSMGCNIKWK